jgi:hypothetical protein
MEIEFADGTPGRFLDPDDDVVVNVIILETDVAPGRIVTTYRPHSAHSHR